MKCSGVVLLVLVFSTFLASARIGETEKQIQQRYGNAIRSYDEQPRHPSRVYSHEGFEIAVAFVDGVSEYERFRKLNDQALSPAEFASIKEISRAKDWKQIASDSWQSPDGTCSLRLERGVAVTVSSEKEMLYQERQLKITESIYTPSRYRPPYDPPGWTSDTFSWDPTIEPFGIILVSAINDHLHAIAGYADPNGTSPTLLEGVEKEDENFWPSVVAQVADDMHGTWKTIERSPNRGRPRTLTIHPKDKPASLYIDLEAFRPCIGKVRYGRLVLTNGKATTFAMKILLPPKAEPLSKSTSGNHLPPKNLRND